MNRKFPYINFAFQKRICLVKSGRKKIAKTIVAFICIAASFNSNIFGQTIEEKLILTDSNDSTYVNARSVNFDINGEYLFEINKDDDEACFLIGSKQKLGPLHRELSTSVKRFTVTTDKSQAYYVSSSSKPFGPVLGAELSDFRFPKSENSRHLAIPCVMKDSIGIYVDGVLKTKIDTLSHSKWRINSRMVSQFEAKKMFFEHEDDWCGLSNNGQCIYTVEDNFMHRLFANGMLIDSSENDFAQLHINNHGDYLYANGRKPRKGEDKRYDYMFFIHTPDTIMGPVRTVWNCELKENGGYYYSGDDNGASYIAVNNMLHKNLKSIANITIVDKVNYLFSYKQSNKTKLNVNGRVCNVPFNEILLPSLDSESNFACYGIENYYLYKYVNGVKSETPISRYGVRAIPLYISPRGSSLHFFRTDDSTYLYNDDKLLFPGFSNFKNFSVRSCADMFPINSKRSKISNGKNLFYIEIDSAGYFVYNGQLSKPMIPVKASSYEDSSRVGEIVAGKFDDNGFFAVQMIGKNKLAVNINNKFYKEIDGVWKILEESSYFDGRKLVLFGIKGLSFYQYTLTL